jgi:hypothetical protein
MVGGCTIPAACSQIFHLLFLAVWGNDVEGNDGSPIWRHGGRFDTVYEEYSTTRRVFPVWKT